MLLRWDWLWFYWSRQVDKRLCWSFAWKKLLELTCLFRIKIHLPFTEVYLIFPNWLLRYLVDLSLSKTIERSDLPSAKRLQMDWKLSWTLVERNGGLRVWPDISTIALHKKWNFPLNNSSVNVTKVSCGFGHISWRSP